MSQEGRQPDSALRGKTEVTYSSGHGKISRGLGISEVNDAVGLSGVNHEGIVTHIDPHDSGSPSSDSVRPR